MQRETFMKRRYFKHVHLTKAAATWKNFITKVKRRKSSVGFELSLSVAEIR